MGVVSSETKKTTTAYNFQAMAMNYKENNQERNYVFHEEKLEECFINFVMWCFVLAWFNMMEINSIYVILYLHSQNDMSSLKL